MFVDKEQRETLSPTKENGSPVEITKLSQAIREGAKLRPQCRGNHLFSGGGSCAFGAAFEAMGMGYIEGAGFQFVPLTLWRRVHDALPNDIWCEIHQRNDLHGHTREKIADWLEAQGL